jgi:hypothetical protein
MSVIKIDKENLPDLSADLAYHIADQDSEKVGDPDTLADIIENYISKNAKKYSEGE